MKALYFCVGCCSDINEFARLHASRAFMPCMPYVPSYLSFLRTLRDLLTRLIYASCASYLCALTHSFPMHPFSIPGNITVSWCFQGVEKKVAQGNARNFLSVFLHWSWTWSYDHQKWIFKSIVMPNSFL